MAVDLPPIQIRAWFHGKSDPVQAAFELLAAAICSICMNPTPTATVTSRSCVSYTADRGRSLRLALDGSNRTSDGEIDASHADRRRSRRPSRRVHAFGADRPGAELRRAPAGGPWNGSCALTALSTWPSLPPVVPSPMLPVVVVTPAPHRAAAAQASREERARSDLCEVSVVAAERTGAQRIRRSPQWLSRRRRRRWQSAPRTRAATTKGTASRARPDGKLILTVCVSFGEQRTPDRNPVGPPTHAHSRRPCNGFRGGARSTRRQVVPRGAAWPHVVAVAAYARTRHAVTPPRRRSASAAHPATRFTLPEPTRHRIEPHGRGRLQDMHGPDGVTPSPVGLVHLIQIGPPTSRSETLRDPESSTSTTHPCGTRRIGPRAADDPSRSCISCTSMRTTLASGPARWRARCRVRRLPRAPRHRLPRAPRLGQRTASNSAMPARAVAA